MSTATVLKLHGAAGTGQAAPAREGAAPAAPLPGPLPASRAAEAPARPWAALLARGPSGRAMALGVLSIAAFLVAWHLASTYRLDAFIRFINVPGPLVVLDRLAHALDNPSFVQNVLISLRRIMLGFCLAALVGVPLGLVMGRFRVVRECVFPLSEALRPIPAIAWVPMSIMLWPTTEASIVFITFLGSFFPILVNTLHGMHALDGVLVRAARCLGASERQLFLEVYLPGTLPQIFTGLTVGMGVAWVSLIAAEMISGQFGIGYFTWEAYSLIQYADIVLGMVCIGVLGLLSSAVIRMIGGLVMPWARGSAVQEGR
ncbi:MAG: ABC transporter permease [Alphaproteobacteria bacterium]|nr:ABC transporter permease [Alphaproteobacteria bacterium]